MEKKFNGKLYKHQIIALKELRNSKNVCISTPTGSGKSAIFYAYGVHIISESPNDRILVMYPTNALAREQYDRWKEVLELSDLPTDRVGIIIGGTPEPERVKILKRAQIVLTNPDVIQMWMFNRLCNGSKNKDSIKPIEVKEFLRNIKLVIMDEVHIYKAAFGSNVAYILRRLNFAIVQLSREKAPQYIVASATIGDTTSFLENLFGCNFEIISHEVETSKQEPLDILFVNSPYKTNIESIQKLLLFFAEFNKTADSKNRIRSIAFMDGRQTVERTILADLSETETKNNEENTGTNTLDSEVNEKPPISDSNVETTTLKTETYNKIFDTEVIQDEDSVLDETHAKTLIDHEIYPFRSGYNIQEIQDIMEAIREDKLNGIVSTSALELGIDIPFLNVAILYGVPESNSSLLQRIGRVGRHEPGLVIIINDNNVRSVDIFSNPGNIDKLQQETPYLYLENKSIMFRNAAMFIGEECEFEVLTSQKRSSYNTYLTGKQKFFPEKFIDLLKIIVESQNVEIFKEYESEINEVDNVHLLGIRNISQQYHLCYHVNREEHELGSTMGFDQVFREAYPGAVYLHKGTAYRVLDIKDRYEKKVILTTYPALRRQKTYPVKLPTIISPNFDNHSALIFESKETNHWLILAGCDIRIEETITGYSMFGKNRKNILYRDIKDSFLDKNKNPHSLKFRKSTFKHKFNTNGITIYSSLFKKVDSETLKSIGDLLFNSFLKTEVVDRQDVDFSHSRLKNNPSILPKTLKSKYDDNVKFCEFISIFDTITNGLGLALQIIKPGVFLEITSKIFNAIQDKGFRNTTEINSAVEGVIEKLYTLVTTTSVQQINLGTKEVEEDTDLVFGVIRRGEKGNHCEHGIVLIRDFEIFKKNGNLNIRYEFVLCNADGSTNNENPIYEAKSLGRITPIEGITQIGTYSFNQEDFID